MSPGFVVVRHVESRLRDGTVVLFLFHDLESAQKHLPEVLALGLGFRDVEGRRRGAACFSRVLCLNLIQSLEEYLGQRGPGEVVRVFCGTGRPQAGPR